MFLSREIDIKLSQNYNNTYLHKIWYGNLSFKQIIFSKYATNLKTTISQRSLKNSGLSSFYDLHAIFFLFLIDIIDKIIFSS